MHVEGDQADDHTRRSVRLAPRGSIDSHPCIFIWQLLICILSFFIAIPVASLACLRQPKWTHMRCCLIVITRFTMTRRTATWRASRSATAMIQRPWWQQKVSRTLLVTGSWHDDILEPGFNHAEATSDGIEDYIDMPGLAFRLTKSYGSKSTSGHFEGA